MKRDILLKGLVEICVKAYSLKNVTVLLLVGTFLLCACDNEIKSTEDLMKEISSRYNGKWFTQLKFSQTVYNYENDSLVGTEINDEEYSFPSNLIIYLTPGDTSNRYICRNDSILIYKNNELDSVEQATHDAIILSMDIYNMKFDEIMKRWEDLPYDINKFHERVDNGRKVYVIGAEKGDSISNQAWFDAEHLYFIKVIKKRKIGLRETIFTDYMSLGDKGWVEQEVIFKLNGKVFMREKYFNIQVIQ